MANAQNAKALFCYAYRPLMPMGGPRDGGFTVNLYDNDILLFQCYDRDRRVTSEMQFALSATVRMRYLHMVQASAQWLGGVRPVLKCTGARYVSQFGFDQFSMIQVEDMEQLMNIGFRSHRGHYTRMLYNFFEDISTMMLESGIDLRLYGFNWDPNQIQPMEIPRSRRIKKSS